MTNEQATTQQTPTIQMEPVESSQYESYGYDAATETLAIKFHGHGDKPGGLYHYRHFSATDWAALRDAPSKGSYFIQNIKKYPDRYPFARIPDAPAAAPAAE